MKIPREQRLCKKCKSLDDEQHFFFDCEINSAIRSDFLKVLNDKLSAFECLDTLNKLLIILNPNPELVCHIGVFIKTVFRTQGFRSLSDRFITYVIECVFAFCLFVFFFQFAIMLLYDML